MILASTHTITSVIAGFDLVDLLVLIAVAFAAARGTKLGAAVQLGSYGGFWVGMIIGALLAPVIGSVVKPGILKTIIALLTLFICASILAGLGRKAGTEIFKSLRKVHLGSIDAILGSGISVLATLLGAWVIAAIAINSPFSTVSAQVANSEIVRAIDKVMPPAPSLFAKIDRLMGSAGFPPVFASIPPQLAGPVGLPSSAQVAKVLAASQASVVKIEGLGCGQIQEGSGFVIANGYVITNAHVIAGISDPVVVDQSGDHPAKPVLFDPKLDIAVLSVPGLSDPKLTFDTTEFNRGTQAVVMGYPEGGPLTYGSAGIMATFNATGRDIYGQGLTDRLVYQIEAIVRPGNSGGPLIDLAGQVVGVVFSRSTTNPQVGFALASPAVAKEGLAAVGKVTGVSTGACIS